MHHSIDLSKYQLSPHSLNISSQKFYFTIVLSQYCFNNTADLSLLIYDRSPISRLTIPEAVVIELVLLMMSSVLLETC